VDEQLWQTDPEASRTPGADGDAGEASVPDAAAGDAVVSLSDEDDRREPAAPPVPPHETRHSRRRFLLITGAVIAGLIGALEALRRMAGPGGGVTGGAAQSVKNLFSSFPVNAVEAIPNKTWSDWSLTVDGLVDKPLTLDAAGWQALPRFIETADFHCVEGWSVDALRWGGVTPSTILKEAKVRPTGAYVVFHAYTGEYLDSLPIDLVGDPQTVLADTLDGKPLPAEHGGPLRLVVPKQLGYKSVKWVTRIEVTDKPVTGYWEHYGYPMDAPIRS
jgi:DMSO/TMAO reductase YedYZ molybdopterin-dependent catalytic subunit